jgi:hypothetical protein
MRKRNLMPRELLALLLFLALASPAGAATRMRLSQADAPEAVLEITRRDLGEVFAGEELEFTFIVRNAGTKALELKEKSSISSRLPGTTHGPSRAMWTTGDRAFIPAAFMRAAPS